MKVLGNAKSMSTPVSTLFDVLFNVCYCLTCTSCYQHSDLGTTWIWVLTGQAPYSHKDTVVKQKDGKNEEAVTWNEVMQQCNKTEQMRA